jgi:hypothetical protein
VVARKDVFRRADLLCGRQEDHVDDEEKGEDQVAADSPQPRGARKARTGYKRGERDDALRRLGKRLDDKPRTHRPRQRLTYPAEGDRDPVIVVLFRVEADDAQDVVRKLPGDDDLRVEQLVEHRVPSW